MDENRLRDALVLSAEHGVELLIAPTGQELIQRGRQRRRKISGVIGAVVVVIGLAGSLAAIEQQSGQSQPDRPPHAKSSSPAVSPQTLAKGSWTQLPTAPIAAREGAASTWTGTQMLIWGGANGVDTPRKTYPSAAEGGAAYTPATNTWTLLPPSPLSPRINALSVWTGSEWFIWGGLTEPNVSRNDYPSDGAIYDPRTRTWKTLPSAPVANSEKAFAVWAGDRIIVLTGRGDQSSIRSASYDPRSDTWTSIQDITLPTGHSPIDAEVIAAGSSVYLMSAWQTPQLTYPRAGGVDSYTLTPDATTWITNRLGASANLGPAFWTGHDVLLATSQHWPGPDGFGGPFLDDVSGLLINPITGHETPVPHNAINNAARAYVWTGNALLGLSQQAALWNPTTDQWTTLPRPPRYIYYTGWTSIVWTGTHLILWGRLAPGTPDSPPVAPSGVAFGN